MTRDLARAKLATAALSMALLAPPVWGVTTFTQTNLVSNIPGLAAYTDPNLANPWGIAHSPTSPWWVADNVTGVSTLYAGTGVSLPLVVTIPGGAPTGAVFNGNSSSFNGDNFIFCTESGSIVGWRGALGTTGEVLMPPASNALYTGLAIASVPGGSRLYAADFRNGVIQAINGAGVAAPTGNFVDPNLPAGYVPFNVAVLNNQLYVTYALETGGGTDDLPGPGHGFVDTFDLNGDFLGRLVTQGELNSPWGLALAPADFGPFANDLLVGNFGDGTINAYDPTTGAFQGALLGTDDNPIVIPGLWGLGFGNNASAGSADSLYFSAELSTAPWATPSDGLFGSLALSAVPEPATAILSLVAGLALAGAALRRPPRPC